MQAQDLRQAEGARSDVHITVDTNNASGYPTMTITSPSDQSSVSNPITVTTTASVKNGMSKTGTCRRQLQIALQLQLNPRDYRTAHGGSDGL